MAQEKISRKELLKSPDEFLTLSNRAARFFSAHVLALKVVGIVVGSLALLYLGGHAYYRHVDTKGQEAYAEAFQAFQKATQGAVKTGELLKAEEMFQKVVDDYGLSDAARLALPQIAYAKFITGKYDDAIALYKKFQVKVSGDVEYESLAKLALASCYESKGDLKTASATLVPLFEQPNNPFRATAMLNLARVYRLEKRPEDEKKVLQEFVQSYPDSPFLAEAKARL